MRLNRKYSYKEVYRRKIGREEKSARAEKDVIRSVAHLYDKDNNSNPSEKLNEATKLLYMIGDSGYLSRKYYAVAKKIVTENADDTNIANIFTDSILPNSPVNDDTELYNIKNLDNEKILDQISANMAIDRLLDNHDALNKNGKLDDFIKNTSNVRLCVDKCCEAVNKVKLPIHGKFTIAVAESMYLLDKNGRYYDDEYVLEEAWNYFSSYNISSKDRRNIIYGLNHNVFKEDTIPDNEFNSNDDPISVFQNSAEKDTNLVDQTLNDVINSYPYQLAVNIGKFFSIVEYQILAANNIVLATYMINIITTIADKLGTSAFISNPGCRERILQVKDKIAVEIAKLTAELKNLVDSVDTETQNLMANFIDRLSELDNELTDLIDNLYPNENMEAMQNFDSNQSMSFERFEYSFKNQFISVAEQANKYIENYLNDIDHSVKNFREANIYDMIDCDHKIDYLFTEYYITHPDQARLNNICIGLNAIIGPSHKCYYTVNEDSVEFHLKENTYLDLTESQSNILKNHFIQEDINKINLIIDLSENAITDYTQQDIIDTFSESSTHELFKPFIEICEYANVSKSEIDPIYEAIFRGNKSNDRFFMESYNAMMNYQPKDAPYDIQLEAGSIISAFAEAKDAKALSAKIKNNVNKVTNKEKKEGGNKNVAGNSDSHPLKNALVNLNLTLRGFKEKIKDLSAKEQNLAKRNDAQFRHFAKTAQDAIVGDRKEAIIKGQLIPSFSKCIKYAIAGGVITAINPIAGIVSVFGAIAVSKHIDNKIKMDMLDELEVELEMIDKEISNADNRGQLKKERALLKTKKQLQRTYQRVKINAKLGKNIISSGYGVPKLDD